jgi:hypothetical protein
MKYALLIYVNLPPGERSESVAGRIDPAIAEVLARPNVAGWVRLLDVESATAVRHEGGGMLLTDGPFVESKEYLAGLITVEADNLDGALAVAADLLPLRHGGGIEIRPVIEQVP